MSDKHTAAQGELAKLQRYEDEQTDYRDFAIAPNPDGQWVKYSDVEALFRASEGQAQTSALKLIYQVYEDNGNWGDTDKHHYDKALTERRIVYLAAQLDDSTAPGVPLEETIQGLTYRQIFQRGRLAAIEDYKPIVAAPTAQQSLTAGGAVPEGLHFNAQRLRNVAHLVGLEGAIPDDDATLDDARGAVLGMIAGRLRGEAAIDKFAAAPLPQVQSDRVATALQRARDAGSKQAVFDRDMRLASMVISHCTARVDQAAARAINMIELAQIIDKHHAAQQAIKPSDQ